MKAFTTKRCLLSVASLLAIALALPGQPANDGQPAGRLLQRIGTGQLRHGSRILCLAYSPNGQLLVAGGGADPVRVWDTKTGLQKYICPENWVTSIVFTPRGSVFITAGMVSKSIKLWDTATDAPIAKAEAELVGHKASIKALALVPAGDMLASADQNGTVILWELTTRKKIIELKQHTDEVTSLAFCPSNEVPILVTGSNDRTVCVWDTDTHQLTKKIDAGCGVLAVTVSRDGKMVFSAGDDNLIRVWETASGKLLHTLQGHAGMVVSLAITRDGNTLISGGRDKSIRLWDIANLTAKPRIIERHLGDSDALAVTRDGQHIATAGLNNTIRVFETATGKELFAGDYPQAGLTGLTLSKDGKTLAAVTAPGIVYMWDAQTGQQLRHFATGHVGDISLAFTPDGQSLVTAAETVRFWDPQTGTQRFELPWAAKERSPVLGMAFSPDGKSLAIGTRDKQVHVYDVAGKRATDTFTYAGPPYALAFSTDNGLLAVSGGSKIVLWDCAGHKELYQFGCKDAPPKTVLPDVAALAFSPDRKTIAAACFDGPIRIIDFTHKDDNNKPAPKEVGICEGHQNVPYAIAFAHDGRTLLSGSFDATVRLWEPFSGSQLAELKGHSGPVYGVALAPDGMRAYSAGADTNLLIWDATGFGKAGPPKHQFVAQEMQQAWDQLASDNAALSRQVAWKLIANPQGVAADIKNRITLVDVARIEKLFADLDSDMFDERDAATKELEKQGRWLEGRLHEALLKPPSLEYKRRVEEMLRKLDVGGALTLAQEQKRMRRAMMVLEAIGDSASVDLLQRLTRQAPEKAFRAEARTTLERMGKVPPKTAGK